MKRRVKVLESLCLYEWRRFANADLTGNKLAGYRSIEPSVSALKLPEHSGYSGSLLTVYKEGATSAVLHWSVQSNFFLSPPMYFSLPSISQSFPHHSSIFSSPFKTSNTTSRLLSLKFRYLLTKSNSVAVNVFTVISSPRTR